MHSVDPLSRKVLVCPGITGNGHPFRCVPIIKILHENKLEVLLAGWKNSCASLKIEFPELETIAFPGCILSSSREGNNPIKAFIHYFTRSLYQNRIRKQIDRIVADRQIMLVISDGLVECRSALATSVLLTHELCNNTNASRYLRRTLLLQKKRLKVKRFNEYWIPDVETLNGLLGTYPLEIGRFHETVFIGILSRFTFPATGLHTMAPKVFDLLILLSGAEPYRTDLEQKVLNQIINLNLQIAIVRGIPGTGEATIIDGRVHIFPELSAGHLSELISQSAMIICRADCDHVADVITLGKRAIFVPLPGDKEQESLARSLLSKKIYFTVRQIHFDLLYAIEMSVNYPGMVIRNDLKVLRERIKVLTLSP